MTDFSALKKLFNIDSPCGYEESDLARWSEKYGAVPKVLKDYYMEVGKHKDLNNAHDFLLSPAQFEDYEEAEYLVFYSENQGGTVWGVKKEDVKKEDVKKDNPPVYGNSGEEEWFLTANSVCEFLLSMAHLQAVISMSYSNEEYADITTEQANRIAKSFLSKQADSQLYAGVKFYGNYDDTVIAVMQNHEACILMYSANSKEHFDETDSIINAILL